MMCLMVSRVFRKAKGSFSIEGAIIFPIIMLFIFFLIGTVFYCYNRVNILATGDYIIRERAYNWYENKGLYDDILNTGDIKGKLNRATKEFYNGINPNFTSSLKGDFSFYSSIFYKALELDGGFSEERINISYPFYRGDIFIRNYNYTREMLEDALGFLDKDNEDYKGDDSERVVYIVDDNSDEREYDRVYHIYNDCFYLKKGYKKEILRGDGRSEGFRCCRICLGKKTGMD